MAAKRSQKQLSESRNATRDIMRELPEYCDRHGYVMPAEFLVAVMNGSDPRVGLDVENIECITMDNSIAAAKTLARYLYVAASSLQVDGDISITVPDVVPNAALLRSLEKKIDEMT